MDKFEGSLGSVITTWTELAMQMYVSERYNEAMEKKRNAPKGRSNGI